MHMHTYNKQIKINFIYFGDVVFSTKGLDHKFEHHQTVGPSHIIAEIVKKIYIYSVEFLVFSKW
jgi:hypothetical protein